MPELHYNSSVFSTAETERPLAAGYLMEDVDTTLITDGATPRSYDAINKMCTSIPTPFARLFLFRTAFREVTNKVIRSDPRNPQIHNEKGLYNYLISDCLDLLEFIFYYGAQPEFGVVAWNKAKELRMLNDESNQRFGGTVEHRRLEKALKDHLADDLVLSRLDTIYLFTWNSDYTNPESQPVVVGGISPFSLVYTSPNWIREKNEKGWSFDGGDATFKLFDNDPTTLTDPRPLSERSPRFKEYLYKMWFAYKGSRNNSLYDFFEYVKQSWDYFDRATSPYAGLENNYSPLNFKNEYSEQLHSIKWDNGSLSDIKVDTFVVGDSTLPAADAHIPLRCMKPSDPTVYGDYMIAFPATDDGLPEERTGAGAPTRVERPLVLDADAIIGGASYYDNKTWGSCCGYMKNWNALSQQEKGCYWERTLPGTNRKYPFLRIDDLLEDKLIGVAESLSNRHFLTGNAGDVAYLPPLKRTFFKYFRLDDLFRTNNDGTIEFNNGIPVIKNNIYCMEIKNNGTVTVRLNIPVCYGTNIELTRTYSEGDNAAYPIVYFDDADDRRQFNLSIFPFYQIQDNPNNKYSVMLGYKGEVQLSFFKASDLNNALQTDEEERTDTKSINTRFYTVDDAFDVIEVKAGDACGLVVPLFQRVKLGTSKMVFCVDFGTTNTHMAYGFDNGTNAINNISDFAYDADEGQVVSLYEIGGYMNYKPAMKREFVPEAIAPSAKDGELAFPIRTSACAAKSWLNDKNATGYKLFGDTNVGFYFLNEEQLDDKASNEYRQNIKWAKGDKNNSLRQAFFDELMWLIKNKAVLSGGSLDFNFYFTYPQSMYGKELSKLYKAWAEARTNVKAGDPATFNMKQTGILHPVEGIVPWYAFRTQGLINAADIYLNVDIGGGTTDMVYQDPDHDENYTYSARFAANDLWGDGIDEMTSIKKDNAFVRSYKANSYPDANTLQKRYEAIVANANDSSDIVSFLFKYDKEYLFSDHLKDSPLMTLLLMHFVSVSYYIGLVLKKDGLAVPQKIGFTGMGSLYVKIISEDPSHIAEIMKSVLRYQGFSNEDVKGLQVVLTNNPKVVTARGGVIFHKPGNNVPTQVESCVWGYDGETDSDTLLQKDVPAKEASVLSQVEDCMCYFESEEFSKTKARLNEGWEFRPLDMGVIMEIASKSFKNWEKANNERGTDLQKDPIFFWPVKDMLYNYGLEKLV